MSNKFFTADLHLKHGGIIKHCRRPFVDYDHQWRVIKTHWNKTIKPGDLTYILGDVCWGSDYSLLKELNGQKIVIKGNHDNEKTLIKARKEGVIQQFYDVKGVRIDGQYIWMSHYAHRTWPLKHYGAWHIYGHSHGTIPDEGKSTDVGVDCWNFYPVSFKELQQRFKDDEETSDDRNTD